MKIYKVRFYQDDTYEIVNTEVGEVEHQGSLSDCEAWIRLKEGGYI